MDGAKERVDLSQLSDKFNENVLIDILSKGCDGKEVELLDWNFGEGFTKGDSYLSVVNKGKVSGITYKERQHVQVNFVVKSLPRNIGRRNTFRSVEFFRNEINFYTKVIPMFERFLVERGQSDLLRIPRYLVSLTDGNNDFIVLEDASFIGFGPASRQNCIDLTECIVILKALAKFHAISFACKDQKKEEFEEITSDLKETYFSPNHWGWYRKFHENLLNIAKHALANEYPNSKAEKQFNSYRFGAFFDKCVELCNRRNAPTSVVCEGDSWAPNFLVRNIGQDQKEALLLDFQLARCASPVIDLSFLIYSCTLKSFRDQHFDDILKIYHSELSNAIKSLGSDPEKIYPWDVFMKEVKENFIFGVTFALEAIPFCLLDPSQSFDLDAIKGDEEVDVSEIFAVSNIQTASGRQRLADVIVHAVEKGFL